MILELGRQALTTTLMVAGPMLAAALLIGLLVSVFQAVTQINEMTMTFVPKIVGILVTGLVALPWVLRVMLTFTRHIFDVIAGL
ncbi:MAG: flagellar biosynthesis protein FliQ [Candidatus Latescibacteria bacterium]|nr:flagellar biosynthesis protein FliQ [bacterium]MCB9515186.1 flagellar biosynthesis protein FliQ [Candidatus Latescibacterota bacterium]